MLTANESTPSPLDPEGEQEWSSDDLEAAYQQALAALDAVEAEVTAVTGEASPAGDVGETAVPSATEIVTENNTSPEPVPAVSAAQVLEALLFVGGPALTAAKMATVLRGDYTAEFVESSLDALNRQYAAEGRPYEIRLGEGGYRLSLCEAYERIRNKVYGLGPREVRLSQETLEVLAIVAYRQPVSEAALTEAGKSQSGPILRQLLRRDLIAVDRDPDQPKEVRYKTTQRFLSLFGIGSLDDLPRPEELLYK